MIQKLTRNFSVAIPVSFFEKVNNSHYNSIDIIEADGTDLGVFKKSHIPDGADESSFELEIARPSFVDTYCLLQIIKRNFISPLLTLALR